MAVAEEDATGPRILVVTGRLDPEAAPQLSSQLADLGRAPIWWNWPGVDIYCSREEALPEMIAAQMRVRIEIRIEKGIIIWV